MQWSGNLEAFLDWCVAPATTGEGELEAALASIPNESWWTVWARLEVALHEEEGRYLPTAHPMIPGREIEVWFPTEETLRNLDIAQEKKELLTNEMRRRR